MASSPITLPPGYSVESQPQGSSLPEGYTVESQGNQEQSPSLLSKAGTIGTDLAKGVGEGALDTVHGVGEIIRRGGNLLHAGAGDAIVPPEGQAAVNQLATPTNLTQKIGKTAEDIGEFVLGDEALKSLSLGKRALEAAGLAEKYEKASPFVRAAIEHTLHAGRQGVVAGAETTTKTGDIKQGAEAGAAAATGSAVLGVAGEALGSGLKYVKAAKQLKELPAALDKGIADTVSQKALADGLKATHGTTAAEHLADSALQYQERAKAGYQMVDSAVDGELQPIQDKLKAVKKAIKIQSNMDPEKAEALKATQTQLEKAFADTIAKAKANGIPDAEDVIKKADADYNKFHAQSQLSRDLSRKATETGAGTPTGMHVWARNLDTPKVVGQTSRLQQALGKDGAEAVRKLTSEGLGKAKELASQSAVGSEIKKHAVVGAAKGAGLAGGGYVTYRILSGH